MKKNEQILRQLVEGLKIDLLKTFVHLFQRWRVQSRLGQHPAQRIDIATIGNAPEQGGFNGRCAAACEGIINDVARLGETFDEEARQLWLETSAIGDFMQPAGGALLRGPEL